MNMNIAIAQLQRLHELRLEIIDEFKEHEQLTLKLDV